MGAGDHEGPQTDAQVAQSKAAVQDKLSSLAARGLSWVQILELLGMAEQFVLGALATPVGQPYDTPAAQLTLGGGVSETWQVNLHGVRTA